MDIDLLWFKMKKNLQVIQNYKKKCHKMLKIIFSTFRTFSVTSVTEISVAEHFFSIDVKPLWNTPITIHILAK